MQNATNASVPSNRRLSPLEQEQLQYCFPGTFAQLAQQGMGHCFPDAGLSVPEARVPTMRPLSFSSLDEGMGFNIMNPQPSCFYGFDKRTLATLNDIDDTNPHLKRETTSPFGTDPGLTNYSSDDVSSLWNDQSSPETFEDAAYTRTPASATFSTFPPLHWSCSPSSSVLSSSVSPSPSAVPYTWNPNIRPADPAPVAGPNSAWSSFSSMSYLPPNNGNQQYLNPSSSFNMNAGWEANFATDTSSTNETMMFNGLPLTDNLLHPEMPSSSYGINSYEGLDIGSSYALQRSQTVPSKYPSATVPTSMSQDVGNASRPAPSQPQSQTMYPAAPTTHSSQIHTTTTAAHIPTNHQFHVPQLQQPSQTTTDTTNVATTMTMNIAPAPAPALASHSPNSRNAFLIDCKCRGLSYKDIKRIGNFREAESTLRGRYRTLTKSKGQRVRKPQWEARDIHLLREAVSIYSYEHSNRRAHSSLNQLQGSLATNSGANNGASNNNNTNPPTAAATSVGLPRVSWKKVAQYIWAHGGSYHFGNATCKKKWCYVNGIDDGR